ncbi:neuroligin-4, Y-linked-like [Copidosoma floridanum]|uniref:neuroligin-4, Y-linked-like n=1 Tax=Copidosoma floridanum TaxID=29053 RepID=UPI000C6FB06C|nr:neuroligin-4, Y-linked-like [Copidosoma floridanum]
MHAGFLKTSSKESSQGNYGLMDLVAGVHWLRENLPAFGGDPNRITLMGHGTGAALANFLAVSPMSKGCTAGEVEKEEEEEEEEEENTEAERKHLREIHRQKTRRKTTTRTTGVRKQWVLVLLLLLLLVNENTEAIKYSSRTVFTRYGMLRGIVTRTPTDSTVEIYLGIAYAAPPVGSLRFMSPITPSSWTPKTRVADVPAPICPQVLPRPEPDMPAAQRTYLARLSALMANQSEDCLYLNLYVPRPLAQHQHQTSGSSSPDQLPALLLIHGDSYSWGAGNTLDGTALAAYGQIIVVTINFRLGILGFLKTSSKESSQGNYGLMDLVAGVHWLRENLPAFGGDPNRITLMGHGTGAALANFLAVSPMSKELIKRVVLLGGSALSPWAVQREPVQVKRRVAEQIGCPGDVETEDIAPCLRQRSIDELMAIKLDIPRFTSGFAPFSDGAILPSLTSSASQNLQPTASTAGLMPGPGSEFANFGDHDLLMGLTSDEAWLELTEQDLQNGMNETRRDRILRTYVRNTYRYHLHEIYSTLRNEYTDWERGEPNPLAISEGLLSLLGDGQVSAPLLRLALLHSSNGGRGYFLHFQPGPRERPIRRAEELPYLLGLPLIRGELAIAAPTNYSAADENLSRLLVHYLSNFVHRGDPNGATMSTPTPFWDSYDSINQLYLEAGPSPEMRSHYRGHKMSTWLNLLPQLHRPGYEVSMRHHHLAESPSLYEGAVRPQSMAMPIPAPPLPLPSPTEPSISSTATTFSKSGTTATVVPATDCTTNLSGNFPLEPPTTIPSNLDLKPGPDNILQKIASKHYQSHTAALTVTIAVGIFLLLLNILIFARIYHQRDKNGSSAAGIDPVRHTQRMAAGSLGILQDKKKEELLEIACTGGVLRDSLASLHGPNKRSLSSFVLQASAGGATDSNSDSGSPVAPAPRKGKFVEELELGLHQLQEYERGSYFSPSPQRTHTPSPCLDATMAVAGECLEDLPEPPPPPKSPAPTSSFVCPGILRQPGTPGCAKKRVQIQEISV